MRALMNLSLPHIVRRMRDIQVTQEVLYTLPLVLGLLMAAVLHPFTFLVRLIEGLELCLVLIEEKRQFMQTDAAIHPPPEWNGGLGLGRRETDTNRKEKRTDVSAT